MGIRELLGLARARDKPKNYYLGSQYSFLFGPTTSGKSVNEVTAMQTTAVYACVRVLAETIASLPLHVYRYEGRNKTRVYDHPLFHLLHDEPNPEMTSFVFRETLMTHLLLWGNAYAQIIRDGAGRVTAPLSTAPQQNVCGADEQWSTGLSLHKGQRPQSQYEEVWADSVGSAGCTSHPRPGL